ncbi:MAG: ABC transporter ATP-binding protein [Corticimicrobacter sp.]|uniref:ABC transporter ATP-binding protein n=1 Tax=Corticimicrobacter sp. TaxID=2678536 RepID=UPI0032DA059B
MLTLIKLSGTSRMAFLLCLIITSAASFVSVLPELFIGYVINTLSGSAKNNTLINAITEWTAYFSGISSLIATGFGFFLLASVLTTLMKDLSGYCATILSEKILSNTRRVLYAKLSRINYHEYMTLTKGQAVNTVMNDTSRLSLIFERPFYTILSDSFDLIWIAVFLSMIDINILLILLCAVPIIYIASIKTGKAQKNIADSIRSVDIRLTEKVEQTVSGYEVIKSLNAESTEVKKFERELKSSLALRIRGAKNLSLFFPIEGCLRAVAITAVGTYISLKVGESALSVGMIAVGILYSNKFFSPIRNISQYYQAIQKGLISAEKIIDFLALPEESLHAPGTQGSAMRQDRVQALVVKNLTFSTRDKDIFSGLSFACHSGQFILIKGRSGAGKTSLFRILLGFHDIPDGCISINQHDINTYDRQQLRSMIAYVSQKPFIHNDTVAHNICYPETDAQATQLHEIMALLNLTHLESPLIHCEEGKNLSGGEMARISFARALLRKPGILLLDETIASLDKENTACILKSIEKINKNGTLVLMATHSNSTELLGMADAVINIR